MRFEQVTRAAVASIAAALLTAAAGRPRPAVRKP